MYCKACTNIFPWAGYMFYVLWLDGNQHLNCYIRTEDWRKIYHSIIKECAWWLKVISIVQENLPFLICSLVCVFFLLFSRVEHRRLQEDDLSGVYGAGILPHPQEAHRPLLPQPGPGGLPQVHRAERRGDGPQQTKESMQSQALTLVLCSPRHWHWCCVVPDNDIGVV